MTLLVSAIVLAFGDEVENCLRSLHAALARIPGPSELIVVLNRTPGGAGEALDADRPDVVLIEPSANLGFSGGVAAGLAKARGEWIALVNDDCVVEVDAIAELLSVGRSHDDIGSVAGQMRFAARPDTINSAGLEVDTLGIAHERLLGASVRSGERRPVEIFGASGGFALYRRKMLDAVGGFDESFFAYLEDADLAWRARMSGWRCVYVPQAVAVHRHSAALGHASPAKHFLVGQNRVRMLAKNATTAQLVRRGAAMVAYDCAYVVFAALRGRTLAPLRGRLRGLSEWRAYRAAGSESRRNILLPRSAGLRAALRRNRVYDAIR